jgi:hypothetical protein
LNLQKLSTLFLFLLPNFICCFFLLHLLTPTFLYTCICLIPSWSLLSTPAAAPITNCVILPKSVCVRTQQLYGMIYHASQPK